MASEFVKVLEKPVVVDRTMGDIHPEGNPYGLHVWGSFQLNKGYEIAGTVFFEVPKDLEFSDTIWDNVEYVRVPYPK